MGKKLKSKARLDKYYYLAKEHGFRSRAAFKLIQLNKKFNFLESSTCLIDLCAAPGGWLQVAAKYMPVSSIKIGVDLDNIKPIHGVTTFQADITSEKCRFLIKKEIKHFQADVVLNDGAPNVGGQWSKDAYNQSELVLFAVKLATEFLKEGGWFITKIFRSSDYNSLMYVLKQLFRKVEATKPQASRNESAEIFVVCQGYKAPSSIDNKLLDPKYALKQIEDEEEMKMNSIKSIKAMFEKKKHRSGYSGKLYNEHSFKDFIECSNPYQFITECNKIKLKTEECHKYVKATKPPMDYELYFEDLQLLGKKEVQQLIIWRNKIRSKVFKREKAPGVAEEPQEEDYEEKKLEEIDQELNQFSRDKKKHLEKEKKKMQKNDLKMKMSFIKEQENPTDNNDVEFDQNLFDFLKKNEIDIEGLDYENKDEFKTIPKQTVEEIDLSEYSEEDYIEMMNEDIEENMKLFEETKKPGKEKKEKRQKVRREKEKEEQVLDDGIVYAKRDDGEDGDDDEDGEDGDDGEDGEEKEEDEKDEDKEANSILDESEEDESIDEGFENPLRKKANMERLNTTSGKEGKKSTKTDGNTNETSAKDEEENLSSDTDNEDGKMIGKKTKRNNTKHNGNKEIDDAGSKSSDSQYNSDDKAEIRAIAKKMLRKKDRIKILNRTYNRFAFEDLNDAPDWFIDDEKQHSQPVKPVTKEEVNIEKEMLKKVNDRMPKKVLEAKARKKNKLAKRMQKVKKQAHVISNQEEISEFSKIKQIERLYKREMNRSKEKKKYVVSRSGKIKTGKTGRNLRFVDKRLKKDKRATKAIEKRSGGGKRRR
jgi:AdoMet-dependent rRNA methyltransferase SPB1